jgi:hypothetical protein
VLTVATLSLQADWKVKRWSDGWWTVREPATRQAVDEGGDDIAYVIGRIDQYMVRWEVSGPRGELLVHVPGCSLVIELVVRSGRDSFDAAFLAGKQDHVAAPPPGAEGPHPIGPWGKGTRGSRRGITPAG